MDERFGPWLVQQGIGANSLNSYLYHARAIEEAYGDLDEQFDLNQFEDLLRTFTYSKDDERTGRDNPSAVPINSHLYKTLASHRTILRRYAQFRDALESEDGIGDLLHVPAPGEDDLVVSDTAIFGLEKDMQTALRANIAQLEPGLEIIDGGSERHVASGFIDILARDRDGTTVIIELKAVKAPLKAQSQIASYMGDIMEETGTLPRGILVAPDFEAKLISAARVMPSLSLTRYRYSFTFESVT